MGFASGTFTFRRFAVVGPGAPQQVDESHLQRLSELALRSDELIAPQEEEYGWCGGRHILDNQFSFEHNVFNDCICFALRVDTNKIPGDLKTAHQLMEEEAVAKSNPSGFISRLQKKEVKQTVQEKLEEELRTGRFRRSRMFPVLWDFPAGMLYCAISGKTFEKLDELFERTFGLNLLPISSGSLALRLLEPKGHRRDYEDAKPTRFVISPDGEGIYPDYPWVLKGPEPKDFLGNEFLLWLWLQIDTNEGVVKINKTDPVELLIDKSLDLDCAFGQSGRDSLRGSGPTTMPEARHALRTGKVPRKCTLMLVLNRQQYELKLSAEDFAFASTRLPEVEDADSPRVLFEERITLLRDLLEGWDALFATFLKIRCSTDWEGQKATIRKWITAGTQTPSAALASVG
ncbi:MAG: hypothetical protein IT448_04640 [Phycisphaerales bacterium]|nr:hypothetical protein [Phycisphaerales bacterium]